jgi:pilus assembly protein CpaF
MSTIHANSAEQALTRFAHCVLTANVGLPHTSTREAIAFAIHLVAHIARQGSHRVVTQLIGVGGYDSPTDTFALETRYARPAAEGDEVGPRVPSAGLQ